MQNSVVNSLFSGAGLFVLRATGRGTLAFGAFGSVHEKRLVAGERLAVDINHVVAWTEQMEYRTDFAASSVWASVTSGEVFNCFFTGPGVVYIQARSEQSFKKWIQQANRAGNGSRSSGGAGAGGLVMNCSCVGFLILVVAILIVVVLVLLSQLDGSASSVVGSAARQGHGYRRF